MFFLVLTKFLNSLSLSCKEEELLFTEIRKIVYFVVDSLGVSVLSDIYVGGRKNIEEEILQESLVLLHSKKDRILAFSEHDAGLKSYIKTAVKNYIIDNLRKKRLYIIDDKIDENMVEHNRSEELVKIEAYEFLNLLNKKLSEKEKNLLCLYIFGQRRKNLKRNTMDKAISRLKKRIKDIYLNSYYSQESVDFCINRLIASEMCKDFVIDRKDIEKSELD